MHNATKTTVYVCVASLAWAIAGDRSSAAQLSFHTTAPIPDADDIYNFVGAPRDGLNVNDENGLDGPLNDNFTYVANDRPRQGQTITAPNAGNLLLVKSIWIRMVGYSANGTMPEANYGGTDADLSAGGEFTIRVMELGPPLLFQTVPTVVLTGLEPNNPAPTQAVVSDNGAGTWLKFTMDPNTAGFIPTKTYAFDIVSRGAANRRFEWLGTNTNAYGGGSAYNGSLPGGGPTSFERTMNPLAGDRVFFIELEAAPEPAAGLLGVVGALGLHLGRRRSVAGRRNFGI